MTHFRVKVYWLDEPGLLRLSVLTPCEIWQPSSDPTPDLCARRVYYQLIIFLVFFHLFSPIQLVQNAGHCPTSRSRCTQARPLRGLALRLVCGPGGPSGPHPRYVSILRLALRGSPVEERFRMRLRLPLREKCCLPGPRPCPFIRYSCVVHETLLTEAIVPCTRCHRGVQSRQGLPQNQPGCRRVPRRERQAVCPERGQEGGGAPRPAEPGQGVPPYHRPSRVHPGRRQARVRRGQCSPEGEPRACFPSTIV